MKKLFQILCVFFIFGILIQIVHTLFSKGYTIEYDVVTNENEIQVKEVYRTQDENKKSQYQFIIGDLFSFEIYENLRKDSRLIRKILLYKDDTYTCIYPIFKNGKIHMDVLCKKDNIQYFYQSLKGKNRSLDDFVSKIDEYDDSYFIDRKDTKKIDLFLTIYPQNIPKNHYMIFQNYKGFSTFFNGRTRKMNLYDRDVYEPTFVANIGKYIITADYKSLYSIQKFYWIDITKNQKKEIHSLYDISYDSYIQGIYKNDVYIFDPVKNRQYKISIEKRKVDLVGDVSKGIWYYDGEKLYQKEIQQKEKMIFLENSINKNPKKGYDYGKRVGNYNYYYQKKNNKIRVFRENIKDLGRITYLFETTEMREVTYQNEYIYFICGGEIKVYSDKMGLKVVAYHTEIPFNKNLKYFLYVK